MKPAEYRALVETLSAEAAADIDAYRSKVKKFILWGKVAIALAILAFVLLILLGIALGVLFRSGYAVYLVVGSGFVGLGATWTALTTKIPQPSGRTLREEEAPMLFQAVRKLAVKMSAPEPSEILVDDSLEAAAAMIKSGGLFSKGKLAVIVGLPLMSLVAPDEFEAILAHELAHHSHQDPTLGLRTYEVVGYWRVMAEKASRRAAWVASFARWYLPRLMARAEAMSRTIEFAADRAAARVTSPVTMGKALLRIRTWNPRVDRAGDLQLEHGDPMNFHYFEWFLTVAKEPIDADFSSMLATQLKKSSGAQDSHPELGERLKALGWKVEGMQDEELAAWPETVKAPLEQTAIEAFFDESSRKKLFEAFDGKVKQDVLASFERKRTVDKEFADKETAWEEAAKVRPPSMKERLERYQGMFNVGRESEGLQGLEELAAEFPDDEDVQLSYGMGLALNKDKRCEDVLGRYVHSPTRGAEVAVVLGHYYESIGESHRARTMQNMAVDSAAEDDAKREEISSLPPKDVYERVEITPKMREEAANVFYRAKRIDRIYVLRRRHPQSSHIFVTAYVLVYRASFTTSGKEKVQQEIVDALNTPDMTFEYAPLMMPNNAPLAKWLAKRTQYLVAERRD